MDDDPTTATTATTTAATPSATGSFPGNQATLAISTPTIIWVSCLSALVLVALALAVFLLCQSCACCGSRKRRGKPGEYLDDRNAFAQWNPEVGKRRSMLIPLELAQVRGRVGSGQEERAPLSPRVVEDAGVGGEGRARGQAPRAQTGRFYARRSSEMGGLGGILGSGRGSGRAM